MNTGLHHTARPRPPIKAYLLLGVGVLAVSFAAIFIKMTVAPPAITAFYRMIMTSVILLPIAGRDSWRLMRRFSVRERGAVTASGALLALHFILWIGSLVYTSVASSTLVLSLQPIFALIGARIFLGERVVRKAWRYALLAVVGTALIGWRDVAAGGTAALGDLLSLGGVVAVTGYLLIGQSLRHKAKALPYSLLVYIVAACVLGLYCVARGYSFTDYGWSDWRAFILLTLIPTILGHTLFNALLKFLPASTVSMSIVGEPLGATALAYVIFGDQVPLAWFVGAALSVTGIVVFMRVTHSASAPDPATAEV
ncbi:MAG: DMT family transporter [Firmicutes bacterium]|nr:DMT family transporter [Bacillota bacterium]